MKIEILDSIECEIPKEDAATIAPCLSFKSSYWVQGPRGKTKREYMKNVFSFKGKTVCRFYTGLLPRVLEYCKKNDIPVDLVGEELRLERQSEPNLKGITFRDDQSKMINTALKKQRGTLVAPTQSGKTIVFLGILSCHPKLNILILSHTTAITGQTHERLIKHGFKDVELFGGGNSAKKPTKRITVSTIQSFASLNPKSYADYYDVVIVDEVHRVSKTKSQYSKVLSNLLAPIRLGFSATLKENDLEAELTYEGLLGPVISRLSIEEATCLDILQKPRIELINSIMPSEIGSVYNYQDVYKKINRYEIECLFFGGDCYTFTVDANSPEEAFNIIHEDLKEENETKEYKLAYKKHSIVNGDRLKIGAYSAGVVENKYRNNQIVELVKKKLKNKKIIFIFVTYTLHGHLIKEAIKKKLGIAVPFIEGATPEKERILVKKGLKDKKVKVCIASNSWMEGLTVKTITDLILAGSGKSELQLLQKAGRVLANSNVCITDFNDSKNKHLSSHTTERFSVYIDKGWI